MIVAGSSEVNYRGLISRPNSSTPTAPSSKRRGSSPTSIASSSVGLTSGWSWTWTTSGGWRQRRRRNLKMWVRETKMERKPEGRRPGLSSLSSHQFAHLSFSITNCGCKDTQRVTLWQLKWNKVDFSWPTSLNVITLTDAFSYRTQRFDSSVSSFLWGRGLHLSNVDHDLCSQSFQGFPWFPLTRHGFDLISLPCSTS